MRKLTWLAVLFAIGGIGAATAADKKPAQKPAATKDKAYVCTHCQTAVAKPGDCPDCKTKLTAAGTTYACPKCGGESNKMGTCAKCKTSLVKNAALYHCDGCGKDAAAAGAC